MKTQKIIVSSILAVLLIGGIIVWKINLNNNSSSQSEISETADVDSNSNKNTNSEGNTTSTESKDTTSNNVEGNNSNNQETSTNNKLSGKDAVTNILKHFVAEDKVKSQHIIPVVLNGQVAKAEDNNTTFFCDSDELTDSTKTGLIVILESYTESNNSYKYILKDYHAIINGKDDSMSSGTVSSDGSVTEE